MPYLTKDELKKIFSKDWKKHYKVDFLVKSGFKRKQCRKCREFFWTLDNDRDVCADASCIGYKFIGKPTKKLDYVETWRKTEKFFTKNGHESIARYPVVCRWRDDLYFTNASIIDFQPYVVTGEIKPPANPLIVPQACLRFGDISNVGVTGGHYTSFIMVGQHAFNSKKTGTFYWKDEALAHDFNLVTRVLGAKKEDVVFHEKVWAGGGTFGPCIEYFVDGIELGNCVFMQYKDLGNGKFEELNTKVIDMGAGLERFAWFTNGSPTSYEVVFGPIIQKMKKQAGIKVDEKLFSQYARLSGLMNVDEQDVKESRHKIAKQLGVSEKHLFGMLKPLQATYAIADHLKTILYSSTDGMLPSNSGGGYNLRILLRKAFSANEEFNLGLDFAEILEGHVNHLAKLDGTLLEGLPTAIDLVEEERKKFAETKVNSKKKIIAVLDKARKEHKHVPAEQMMTIYQSYGVPLELIEDEANQAGVKLEQVDDFYGALAKENEVVAEKDKTAYNVSKYKKTKQMFYEDQGLDEFTAKVVGVEGNYIILDQTAFYPESGGQAADLGILNDSKVTDVVKSEGVILHAVKDTKKFKKGTKVFGKVDMMRRKILEKQHSGAHILNAACRHLLGQHIWQAGAYKDTEKAHLDVTHYRKITDQELGKIELAANKLIQDNLKITVTYMDRGEAEGKYGFRLYQGGYVPGKTIRVINVQDLDVEACGGLHAGSTGEIGFLKIIKRENIKDGVERLVFTTGIQAVKLAQQRDNLLKQSADVLSVPFQELPKSTEKFFGQWKEQRKLIDGLKEARIAALKARMVKQVKANQARAFVEGLDASAMAQLAQRVLAEKPTAVVVIANRKGNLLVMAGERNKKKAIDVFNQIAKKVKARGGGNVKLAQGFAQDINALRKFFK